MKLNKGLILGLGALAAFGMGTVNAADSTYIKSVANPGYTVTYKTRSPLPSITNDYVVLGGSAINSTDEFAFYITDVEVDPTTLLTENATSGCASLNTMSNAVKAWHSFTQSAGSTYVSGELFALKDFNKVYVVKRHQNPADNYKYTCEVTSTPITLTKVATSKLGTRYDTFLFNDVDVDGKHISNFPQFPAPAKATAPTSAVFEGNTTRYVKVGKITNNDLIYKLQRNKDGSLEELLTYAKNNDGTVFTFTDGVTKVDVPADYKVEEGAFYYIYTYYNEPKYRDDLEDVIFTKADREMIVKYTDYIDDYEVIKGSDKVTENPKTGVFDYIWALPIVLVGGYAAYRVVKSRRKFN